MKKFSGVARRLNRCGAVKYLLGLAVLLLTVSCTNLTDSFDEAVESAPSKSAVSYTFRGNLSFTGGLPSEIAQGITENQSSSARTALPSMNKGLLAATPTMEYFAIAKQSGKNDVEGVFESGKAFAITLDKGSWTITAGIRNVSDKSKILLSDTFETTLSSENPVLNHTFYPAPSFEGQGSIELNFSVPDSVTKVTASYNDQTDTLTKSGTTFQFVKDSVSSGSYDITFTFYSEKNSSNGSYFLTLYSTHQTVNVFDNMKTDEWVSDGSFSADTDTGSFELTDTMLTNYARNTFYVGSTEVGQASDESGEGSPYAPYATLTRVMNIISSTGSSSIDYRILVSGKVLCNTSENEFVWDNDNLSGKAKSITIQKEENAETAILDGNNKGSVLRIKASLPVTIRGITITNGNASVYSDDENSGGGIRLWNRANVTIDGGTVITGNTAKNYGGGISVSGSAKLTLKDCEISGNTAPTGGAIYASTEFSISGTTYIPCGSDKKNLVYLEDGGIVNINGTLQPTSGVSENLTFGNLKRGTTVIKTSSSNVKDYENCFALLDSSWEKIISDDGKSIKIDSPFYISATGGTSDSRADGTALKPFDSFTSLISSRELNDSTTNYTVKIVGKVTGNQTIPATGFSAASLTIEGAQGLLNGEPQDSLKGNGGRVLTINSTVEVIIKNLKITGGYGTDGGGIYMGSGSTVTLESGAIVGDSTKSVASSSSYGNMATSGGGIYNDGGTLTLKAGSSVCRNYASASATGSSAKGGGGIYSKAGSVTIEEGAGVVYNYCASRGGGIALENGAKLTSSGSIDNNTGVYFGGGICFSNEGTDANSTEFTMTGGSISGNKVTSNDSSWGPGGGGIYSDRGKITISGTSVISGNTCSFYGGGVRIAGDVIFEMQGGTISGNSANAGGAVHSSAIFKIKGKSFIPYGVTNEAGTVETGAGKNDFFLDKDKYITITDTLTASTPVATLTMAEWKRGTAVAMADGINVKDLTSYKDGYFDYTESGWDTYVSSDKQTITINQPIHISSSGKASAAGTLADPFNSIENAVKGLLNDKNADYIMLVDSKLEGLQILPETLKKDGTGSYNAKSITIQGSEKNVSSRYELNGKNKGSVLTIKTSVPVTILNLIITGGNKETGNGGGICISEASADVTLGDGTIDNGVRVSINYAVKGGGIYNKGKLTLTNGVTISGNEVWPNSSVDSGGTADGGGIWSDKTLIMEGGVISSNQAGTSTGNIGDGGGVLFSGTFEMKGGAIWGNTSKNRGAGVYNNGGTLFMSGTSQIGLLDSSASAAPDSSSYTANKAAGNGGGIYNAGENAKLYIGYKDVNTTDGKFTGGIIYNYSGSSGGGICLINGQCFIAGGSISNNDSYDSGKAIYVDAQLTLTGSPKITSDFGNSEIYLNSNKTITLGGKITSPERILVIPSTYTNDKTILEGDGLAQSYEKFKTADSGWSIMSNGKLLKATETGSRNINDTSKTYIFSDTNSAQLDINTSGTENCVYNLILRNFTRNAGQWQSGLIIYNKASGTTVTANITLEGTNKIIGHNHGGFKLSDDSGGSLGSTVNVVFDTISSGSFEFGATYDDAKDFQPEVTNWNVSIADGCTFSGTVGSTSYTNPTEFFNAAKSCMDGSKFTITRN